MDGFSIAHLDDIEERTNGNMRWRAIRHHFGLSGFGATAWMAPEVGDRLMPEHDESGPGADQELYLVLRGSAIFELDGERHRAPLGTCVAVAPGVTRTAYAEQADTIVLALGAPPDQPYEPSGWELWMSLRQLYDAGRYAEVADRGRELLAGDPPYGMLFFNVACCESLAGRRAEALEHLRRAIELHAPLRELAREDPDLTALRDEPEFGRLIDS